MFNTLPVNGPGSWVRRTPIAPFHRSVILQELLRTKPRAKVPVISYLIYFIINLVERFGLIHRFCHQDDVMVIGKKVVLYF